MCCSSGLACRASSRAGAPRPGAARLLHDRARAADPRRGVLHARSDSEHVPRGRQVAGPGALAASGLLLAAAATIRTAALFAVPVWIAYVLVAHGRARVVAAALGLCSCRWLPTWAPRRQHGPLRPRAGGRLVPLRPGRPFADCGSADIPADARPLCDRTARDRREGAAFHIWNADGPARRNFGPNEPRSRSAGRSNACLAARSPPRSSATVPASTPAPSRRLPALLRPGEMSRGNSDLALTLPEDGRLVRRNAAGPRPLVPELRAAGPPARRVRARPTRSGFTPRAGCWRCSHWRTCCAARSRHIRRHRPPTAPPPRGVPADRRCPCDAARVPRRRRSSSCAT